MTKREIIYTVLEKMKVYSDDSRLSEEFISSLIDTKRSLLLKQQYSKTAWHMPTEIKQEVCMTLELVTAVDGYDGSGTILKTTEKLPKSIKIKGKEGPLAVRKLDGSEVGISIVPAERMPFIRNNPYTSHLLHCSVDFDRKLIVLSSNDKHKFLKTIRVTDVFERPDEVYSLQCDVDNSLHNFDQEYPAETAMVDTMVELVMKDLYATMQITPDKENDSSDDRQ